RFSFSSFPQKKMENEILAWQKKGNDPKKVRLLVLKNVEKLDPVIGRFENIEKVQFSMCGEAILENIHLLPNIQEIELDLTHARYSADLNKLRKLNAFRLRKSSITGVLDHTFLTSLSDLELFYGAMGNDTLPLERIQCLERLRIIGMIEGSIILNQIDFSRMTCLESVYINNTYGGMTGFPVHLAENKLDYFRMVNFSFSQAEQALYQQYKK
ncbi:MAG: hypothetical protein AAF206_07535, partial [Bacteroidota bacterium]